MKPCNDDLMIELERLRAEMREVRRRQHALSGQRLGDRLRVTVGCLAGALGVWALSAFVPTLGAQGGSSTISGCVVPTNHNYLRIAAKCAPGEFKVELATGDTAKDPKAQPPNKPMKVYAPFEVLDEKGVVIMQVTSSRENVRGLRIFDDAGKQVAAMNNLDGGAIVKVFKGDSGDDYAVTIGATQAMTGLLLREGGPTPRVSISAEKGAGLGLRVFNASGKLSAAIGHNSGGGGLMTVSDPTGKYRAIVDGVRGTISVRNSKEAPVAALGVQNDQGVIQVESAAGGPLAVLTQSAAGNGLLHLYDAGGTTMVEAGTSKAGAGFVGAGPGSRAMLPGIPGSFIIGKR